MMRVWRNGREIVEMQSMHIRIIFSCFGAAAGTYFKLARHHRGF
jgi:hypothetical protein